MKETIVKCIRSDNKEFIIGESDWKIKEMKGIDYPNFNVFSEKNAIGDGALPSGDRVADRDVTVVAKSRNPVLNDIIRRSALAFFNVKYTYKIYVTYLGTTRWIEGRIEGFKCPASNSYRPMTMTVKFYCAAPYWKSVDNFGKDIASIQGMFGFPYIQTSTILLKPSIFNFAKLVDISNDGDVETYCTAVVRFKEQAKNPKIIKDEYFVRVLDNFNSGDVLEIDFENCTIKKNGVNIIQKIDRQSTFTDMQMDIGDNKIGFGADSGDNNMSVTIYYNKLYLGV